MNKILNIAFFFIALPAVAFGSNDQTRYLWNWEGPFRTFSDYFEFNPSATYSLPSTHYAILGADFGASEADEKMHLVQEGDGSVALNIQTKSFQKNNKQSFFGEARFTSDQRTNVQWCDVEDRTLLNPYLIADSIGGDYYREAYQMGGGTSLRTGNWELGLRGSYKGSVSYRKVDPRPRNTVSSIRINPGLTYFAGAWKLGWYGTYERYRQNVDIQVEKEGRKDYFYLLQGFGTYNKQFSELDENYTRIYKGNLFSTGVHAHFTTSTASQTGVRLSVRREVLEASESDRRTPYNITHNGMGGEVTHQQPIGGKTLFLKGSYDFLQTIGNETQYTPQTIQSNYVIWNFATQSDRYQSLNQVAELSVLVADQKSEKRSLWGQANLRWQDDKNYYYTPNYHQSIQDVTASATLGLHSPMKKTAWDAEICGGYKKVLTSSLFESENNVLAERLVVPDFAFLTSDYAFYTAKINIRMGRVSATLLGGLQQNNQLLSVYTQTGLTLHF